MKTFEMAFFMSFIIEIQNWRLKLRVTTLGAEQNLSENLKILFGLFQW